MTRREEELGVVPAWGAMGVTEEQARAKCAATLQDSVAGKACAGLDVGLQERMSECMLDIQARAAFTPVMHSEHYCCRHVRWLAFITMAM